MLYTYLGMAFLFLFVILYFVPVGLWFTAIISGVDITLMQLILMRLRGALIKEIVPALIKAQKVGLNIEREKLEAHSIAEGNVTNLVDGLIIAHKAGLTLSFEKAAAADLQGIDLKKAIKEKIDKEKVIETLFE